MVTVAGAVVTALEVAALSLALALSVIGFRAYRRTGTAMYRTAGVGFLLVTAALVVEAVLVRFGEFPATTVDAAEALLFVLGLGALYLSLQ